MSRMNELIHKAASIGGLTHDEISEWHRLLLTEAV